MNHQQLAISRISETEPNLTIGHFEWAFSQLHTDEKSVTFDGLSILQLCLITAMKRLREQEVFITNFEQVHKEFNDFASLHLRQMLVEKAVCLKVKLQDIKVNSFFRHSNNYWRWK